MLGSALLQRILNDLYARVVPGLLSIVQADQ